MAERHKRFQGTEHSRETTKSKKVTQNTIRERTWKGNANWNLSKVNKNEKINDYSEMVGKITPH